MVLCAPMTDPPRKQDPLVTPVALPDRRLLERGGKSIPTPFHAAAPTLLMLEPGNATLQACVRVAVELRIRPVSATTATLEASAGSTRPLAIIVETTRPIDDERLADVAFAVGALIVRVGPDESQDTVEQRVRSAVEASFKLRADGE